MENEMKRADKRIVYFDYMRLIFAFCVVLAHICTLNWGSVSVNDVDWHLLNCFLAPCHAVVPLFFMISGALFLDTSKEICIRKLYSKNILKLLVAFLFWSLLYAIVDRPDGIAAFLKSVATGKYHMWFILSLIGCYVAVPFLRKITESQKLTKYFILTGVIYSALISHIFPLMAESSVGAISVFGTAMKTFFTGINFTMGYGYALFFVMGYYLHTTEFSKKARRVIYILGVLGLVLTIGLASLFSVLKQQPTDMYYKKFSLNLIAAAVAFFVFAKYNFSKISLSEKGSKLLSNLSKYTLGCYFVHAFFVDIMEGVLHIDAVFISPLITVPIASVIIYLVSMGVSVILNKIPIVNKYLV